MAFNDILKRIVDYYTEKIKTYGPEHRGVDWNSVESQELRFDQLLKLCETKGPLTLNDYGCGYAGLAQHMSSKGYSFTYFGYDLSLAMVEHARTILALLPGSMVFNDHNQLPIADYTVASGIFNVKMDVNPERWLAYILDTLQIVALHSKRGFAFNLLTGYADPERMRPDLYYGDPFFFFDYCRNNFSRYVTLLHDYKLYEWTMIV